MLLQDIPIFLKDDRGTIFRCEPVNYIVRKKGSVSADHTHPEAETLYLIEGKVELTVKEETKTVSAPITIQVPPNEYHKLVALTDIKLIRAE